MKAVVVEIKGNDVAVLSEDGQISKIKNKSYKLGQEIIIKNNNKYIKIAASVAAALAIFVTPTWAYLTPYSYVSLDVNPSFEFSINRFDRVLEVKAINSGEKIVEDASLSKLKNKEIKEAVKNVIVELKDQGYINDSGAGVVVAASSKSDEKTKELTSSLKLAIEEEVTKESEAKEVILDENEKDEKVAKIENEIKGTNDESKEEPINSLPVEKQEQQAVKEVKEEKAEEKTTNKSEEKQENQEKNKSEKKELKEKSKETKKAEKEKAKEIKEFEKEKKEEAKENKKSEKNKVEVKVIGISQDEVKEAKEHNVTPGKWNLIERLREVYPNDKTFNEEEYLNKAIKDIMKEIKEYEKQDKKNN